jgi:uncharacterized protein (DUF1800 family)
MATTEAKVAHIWRRLGFGGRRSDLDAGVTKGTAAVLDGFFAKPLITFGQSGFPAASANQDANALRQLELMAWGPVAAGATVPASTYNPLQERISWILQGLVVVGIADSVYVADMRDHIKHLRGAMGGTYRSLLRTVATRPGMLKYLTGDRNTRDHPNQNFGRELLELFALGRVDPATGAVNYTQTDVVEVSRALSGWRYNWTTGGTYFSPSDWDSGAKTFLGAPRGAAGLDQVVAAVVAHPSYRRHVPARVYKELTGFTATPAVLDALASSWGADGNIKALVRAITRRPEFLSDAAIFNRTKTPVERLVAATRLLRWPRLGNDINLPWMMSRMAQNPLTPPNVSGWPKGDQWLNASNLHTWSEMATYMAMRGFTWDGSVIGAISPTVTRLHTGASAATAATYAMKLAGLSPASSRTKSALTAYATAGSWTPARAAGVLNLVLLSPEFLAN